MNEVTLRGSYHEMGRQIGRALRESGTSLPSLNREQHDVVDALVRRVESLIPELFAEMRGLAEAGGYETESVYFYSLCIGIVPSCTVVATSGQHTASGRPVFGRNYDSGLESAEFTLYRTYPTGAYCHIGCAYDLLIGREDGINEKGLAIAVTGVQGKTTARPGLWDHIPVRAVLDRCSTVEEAVGLLESLPHLWTKNFLIADSTGGLAIVEAAQARVEIRRMPDGFAAITNHFVSPQMKHLCNMEQVPGNSADRLRNATSWFETRRAADEHPIDCNALKMLLSSTQSGVRSEVDATFQTVWSWVAELGYRQFDLCDRLPEVAGYRTHEF